MSMIFVHVQINNEMRRVIAETPVNPAQLLPHIRWVKTKIWCIQKRFCRITCCAWKYSEFNAGEFVWRMDSCV